MVRFTSFDDVKVFMQGIIKENGVGAITGPVLQDVLGEILDTAKFRVDVSGSSSDSRALAAEGWAVGTQRGVSVKDGSPYYHNNSLYWANVVGQIARDLQSVVVAAQNATAGADKVDAEMNGSILTVTNRKGESKSVETKGVSGGMLFPMMLFDTETGVLSVTGLQQEVDRIWYDELTAQLVVRMYD